MTEPTVRRQATGDDATRRAALIALFFGILAVAAGYLAAFSTSGTPVWAAWLLALGIPAALGAIMILGATRGRRGIGPLKIPFAFVVVVLVRLLPIVVLPIAYALTFETQTLSAEDVERVRALALENQLAKENAAREPIDGRLGG